MMAPNVRYCTSADGTRIAYAIHGEGFPLVSLTPFIHSFSLERTDYIQRIEGLGCSLVQYDIRGMGLSQRDVTDFSLEARLSDLEAVVRAAGLATFHLFGALWSGPVAIAFAARHPERVDHLLVYGTAARSPWAWDQLKPLIDLARTNWVLASQVTADFSDRDTETTPIDAELAGRTAKLFRESADGPTVAEFMTQAFAVDVTDLLASVRAPTLVLHRRTDRTVPFSAAQELAARLPDARLVPLEGTSLTFSSADDAAWKAIFSFLGVAEPGAGAPSPPHKAVGSLLSGTAIILFADIADSTALTERLGDVAFRERARELDEALRLAIASNGGTAIKGKLLGDGVLATFGAAREAIACAEACQGEGRHAGLPLHVGIHAGEVIRESNNVFGGAVNIAARVAGEAVAGETLVSQTVRDLARTSAGVSFEDRGERELKGVGEPVRLYEVRWQE